MRKFINRCGIRSIPAAAATSFRSHHSTSCGDDNNKGGCGDASCTTTSSSSSSLGPTQEQQLTAIAQHITRERPPSGSTIDSLLEYNKEWSKHIQAVSPDFFHELNKQQNPQYLWIGCSDSRVPANQVVGLSPGEVFVHRNVGNVVSRADLNCLSVIQFAVEILKVEHIIVCGHYNCGCVKAANEDLRLGLVDNWVRHVVDVKRKYTNTLDSCHKSNHFPALCELNAIQQMSNVVDSGLIQDYWKRDDVQDVTVHGWCYGLDDGIVNPLLSITKNDNLHDKVDDAVSAIKWRYSREKSEKRN